MVFKQNLRIPKDRADGSSGFVKVKRGDTPEEHGFSPEQMEALAPLLMDGGGVTATVTLDREELLALLTEEEKLFYCFMHMLAADPNKEDEALWTASGKPRMEILEDFLDDKSITEGRRNKAWKKYEEGHEK